MRVEFKARYFKDQKDLQTYAERLAKVVKSPCVIFLSGSLGSGKTTFVQGFLRGLDFKGRVKSPTFTLVEEYFLHGQPIYHFDIYRIHDPEELDLMGIRDYFKQAICLVEWPECALGFLPKPDLYYRFEICEEGRNMILEEVSKEGRGILKAMEGEF